jgi:hypothetical protein
MLVSQVIAYHPPSTTLNSQFSPSQEPPTSRPVLTFTMQYQYPHMSGSDKQHGKKLDVNVRMQKTVLSSMSITYFSYYRVTEGFLL